MYNVEDTISKVFLNRVEKYGEKVWITHKQMGRWSDVSWNETRDVVEKISFGMVELGLEKGDMVAILSETCPQYWFCVLGLICGGGVHAPIYFTDSPAQCEYILNNSGAKLAIVEDQEQLDKILGIWDNVPNLENVIVYKKFQEKGHPHLFSYDQLEKMGEEYRAKNGNDEFIKRVESCQPDDMVTLIYTSGTTGAPKGAMISNRNVLAANKAWDYPYGMTDKDRTMAFLPMAHIAELLQGEMLRLFNGAHISFCENYEAASQNIREVKPTCILSTPRFWEKIYNELIGIIADAPWPRKILINIAFRIGTKRSQYRQNKKRIPLWLKLCYFFASIVVFRRIRWYFGKKVRVALSGGAPISPKILEFFEAAGLTLLEVYGMTETCGPVTGNTPEDYHIGSVGKPLPGSEVRLSADGELLLKNPDMLCSGYWKRPEENAELYDEDGWMHTGDIAEFDSDGFLRITDRKKNIIINAAGKNIAPQNIENLLKTSRYISQSTVFGEGKPYLITVLTLDEDEVIRYARENKIIYGDFRDLTKTQPVIDLIWEEIKKKNAEMARVEQIRKFIILEEEFHQDDEEVTPTQKVKRQTIEGRYGDYIKELYRKPYDEHNLILPPGAGS